MYVISNTQVSDYCYLEHVVSLWKLISVERTRISVRNNEVSFLIIIKTVIIDFKLSFKVGTI